METDLNWDYLRSIYDYDPDTGHFTHKTGRPRGGWAKPGKIAGCRRSDGYILIRIKGFNYRAHRLAWFYTHGRWPTDLIDHANGDPSDNRIHNLREATRSSNAANSKRPSDNTSGYKGVTLAKRSQRWQAQVNGRYLGLFSTVEAAADAYARAAKELHGEFARTA
jgi:hypothetical protein